MATPSRRPSPSAVGAERSIARRRNALLALARRHGHVRLRIGHGAPADSAATSELLDGLNEEGLLRYGGLRREAEGGELIYLCTA